MGSKLHKNHTCLVKRPSVTQHKHKEDRTLVLSFFLVGRQKQISRQFRRIRLLSDEEKQCPLGMGTDMGLLCYLLAPSFPSQTPPDQWPQRCTLSLLQTLPPRGRPQPRASMYSALMPHRNLSSASGPCAHWSPTQLDSLEYLKGPGPLHPVPVSQHNTARCGKGRKPISTNLTLLSLDLKSAKNKHYCMQERSVKKKYCQKNASSISDT